MKYIFLLATVAMIAGNGLFPTSIATIVRKTNSFIKILQFINPNHPWKNGVKQIKTI